MAHERAERPLPLAGLRVLDIATLIAAPTAARHLADFGADVVKIERPGDGDPIRFLEFHKDDVSLWWKSIARNKLPMTLDLKEPQGAEIFLRLVEHADVLVENFRPGALERLGFAPAVLWEHNPGLVVLRVSGFGQTGPSATHSGFGTAAEAFSGYAVLTGYPDRPPLLPPVALADELTGLTGAFGVMVALYHRDVHGGRGQVVDAALYESLLALLGPLPAAWQHNGTLQARQGSRMPYTAPRNTYRTSDGKWVALSASSPEAALRIFDAIGRPGLRDDPRFADNASRLANLDALDAIIAEWIARHPVGTVLAAFEAAHASIARVHDMRSAFDDPQYAARRSIVHVPDAELGDVAMQGVFPVLSETPGAVRHAGLPQGAGSEEVLRGLGYSPAEIVQLRKRGVV